MSLAPFPGNRGFFLRLFFKQVRKKSLGMMTFLRGTETVPFFPYSEQGNCIDPGNKKASLFPANSF